MIHHEHHILTQETFRLLLQSTIHPGTIYNLPGLASRFRKKRAESNWSPYLVAVFMTLLDHEVTFSVQEEQEKGFRNEVMRQTGSRPAQIGEADFVIAFSGGGVAWLLRVKRGTLEYPDRGATIIFMVGPFSSANGKGVNLCLKGPGIRGEKEIVINGVGRDLFLNLKEVNQEYPMGVDSFFIDEDGRMISIPRSTRIEVK